MGDRIAYLPGGMPAGPSGYCELHAHWPSLIATIGETKRLTGAPSLTLAPLNLPSDS